MRGGASGRVAHLRDGASFAEVDLFVDAGAIYVWLGPDPSGDPARLKVTGAIPGDKLGY